MVGFLIMLIIVGLIGGGIARMLMPGRDPMGLLGTIALGIGGSFIGGFVQNLAEYHTLDVTRFRATGIIGSVIGALILLLLLRLARRGRPRGRY